MKQQAECPVCGWIREIDPELTSYTCHFCRSEVPVTNKLRDLQMGYRIDRLSQALVNQAQILRNQDETIRSLLKLLSPDLERPEPGSAFMLREEGSQRYWNTKIGWVPRPELATRYDAKTRVVYPPNAAIEPVWISPTAS